MITWRSSDTTQSQPLKKSSHGPVTAKIKMASTPNHVVRSDPRDTIHARTTVKALSADLSSLQLVSATSMPIAARFCALSTLAFLVVARIRHSPVVSSSRTMDPPVATVTTISLLPKPYVQLNKFFSSLGSTDNSNCPASWARSSDLHL